MKHTVEIKNNKVYKTYSSRIDFIKEESIYKKLKGTGLAPELLDSQDGVLEHEYVEGESYLEMIKNAGDDYQKLEKLFVMFFVWYERFRNFTNFAIGQVRFDKFLVVGDRLCNLDFENSKPGFVEDDLARLISQVYFDGTAYKNHDYEMIRFLVYVASKNMKYNAEVLYDRIKKEILNEAKIKGVPVSETEMELIATGLTSAGIVFAGGDNPLAEISLDFKLLPQRVLSVTKARGMNGFTLDDFERILTNSKSPSTLERIVDTQRNINQPWTVLVSAERGKVPDILWSAILSADKEECAAVMVEANGKLREFPMLLNTGKTKLKLESELRQNEKTSLKDVLSKMNVKVIKLEDIRS